MSVDLGPSPLTILERPFLEEIMNTKRLPWVVVLAVMLAILAMVAGEASLAGPCAPGTNYDPACDADHDGDVDVIDIQLAAGHFNQTGVWTSDNDHNHLGQTWTGANNPLRIDGYYGNSFPEASAPLILSNSSVIGGNGLWVDSAKSTGVVVKSADEVGFGVISAGLAGVEVQNAGSVGIYVIHSGGDGALVGTAVGTGYGVYSTGSDGVFVGTAGSPSQSLFTNDRNGFEVGGAEDNGLYVGRADQNGVRVLSTNEDGVLVDFANRHGLEVSSTGNDGVHIQAAGTHGVYVEQAGQDGVEIMGAAGDGFRIGNADGDGVYVNAAGDYAGYFNGIVYATQYLGGQIVEFAINASNGVLEPGTLVAPTGIKSAGIANAESVIQVIPADGSRAPVGVFIGRADPKSKNVADEDNPNLVTRLVVTQESARPGEYVSVLVFGKTKLQANNTGGPITAGSRVAIDGSTGSVRALRSVEVEGLQLAEDAPIVGIALENLGADEGMLWVYVNPR